MSLASESYLEAIDSILTLTDTLRLRLQDSTGNDITDIERYFKNKDVLVFYAGSEGGSSEYIRRTSSRAAAEIGRFGVLLQIGFKADPQTT